MEERSLYSTADFRYPEPSFRAAKARDGEAPSLAREAGALPNPGVACGDLRRQNRGVCHENVRVGQAYLEIRQENVEVGEENMDVWSANVGVFHDNTDVSHENVEVRDENMDVSQANVEVREENMDVSQANVEVRGDNMDVGRANIEVFHDNMDVFVSDMIGASCGKRSASRHNDHAAGCLEGTGV
jgi:hypothetical protein